ncbi:MAG: mannitol-1-phosphate 5-dehydrogenase, partial [Pseudoclavibacter sp.]|nr:mannitol-1-phosphate 5-dehydrogenase [Pseudoclavibacter sp.]
MKKAVHFGAGNIGRGFVGLVLHQAGYELVFADVNAELIAALQAADAYEVAEVGAHARRHRVDRFRALDSRAQEAQLVEEIATAELASCAVGPNVLPFIAPLLREGLRARSADAPKLVVMACENAIGASDTLAGHVLERAPELAERAVFANTAVDRIVPAQHLGGVDVEVEDFYEWSIDRRPFDGREPSIPGAHFVDDLTPYIERKLFTVNTGHATLAYHGFRAGARTLAEALADPAIRAELERVLAETGALLIDKFSFAPEEHAAYAARTVERFENPQLPDTPARVGRQPLRKLSRQERFIRPAAEAAERGLAHEGLLAAIGACLRFDDPQDPQAAELRRRLRSTEAARLTAEVTGLEREHPLFEEVRAVVEQARAELR